MTISDSWFTNIEAVTDGGFMYNVDRPAYTGYSNALSFTNVKFDNSKARKNAGGFYISNTYINSFLFSTATFTNILAMDGDGGIFKIEGFGGTMTMTSCTFSTFKVDNNDLTIKH